MTEPLHTLTDQEKAEILRRSGGADLDTCRTCDKCVTKCFIKDSYPGITPKDITTAVREGAVESIADSEFVWACTLCGGCMLECPKDVHIDVIVRLLRNVARLRGNTYKRLEEGLEKIKEIGNSVGVDTEEFVENIEFLAEDAVSDIPGVDEDTFTLPVDKKGAEYLYIPNPREFTSAPHMFSVYLKLFITLGIDWTFASNLCDISNWAYYMGDDETNVALNRKIVDTARELGVKAILSTECGHGFKVIRKDAAEVLGEPLGLEVVSVVELAHKAFKEGRMKLRKGAIDEKTTYHDPCNVGRKLGIYEEPRELLRHISREFVEMEPHSREAICCGGGGSVAQNTDMGQKRLEFGKAKADQIKATGATMVSTSCQMCHAQLSDIQAHYELPVQNKTVIELVMESLEE